jgi:hypothetical protein
MTLRQGIYHRLQGFGCTLCWAAFFGYSHTAFSKIPNNAFPIFFIEHDDMPNFAILKKYISHVISFLAERPLHALLACAHVERNQPIFKSFHWRITNAANYIPLAIYCRRCSPLPANASRRIVYINLYAVFANMI